MKVDVIGMRGFPGIQGGVERHCEALYSRMDCDFRVYRRKPYLTSASSRRYPRIEFVDLPSTRIKGFETLFHSFLAAIRSCFSRPDLVAVHNIGPGLVIPLLKLAGLKVVMTYHSANYEHRKWGKFARMLLRLGEKVSLSNADHIIFVNPKRMAMYDEKVRRKSEWIANGVVREPRTESTEYLRTLGLEGEPYVLAVGRLTPEKDFATLIKAVNNSPRIKHLVIAGGSDHDSSYFETLRKLDTEGKVIFTGNLSGEPLRELYSHASLYVLSSTNEGFPLVVLEAMNYGLPLVISDIPATEILPLPPEWKFLPGDVDSLVEKLEQRYNDKPELVAYDISPYDWTEISRRTQAAYRKALGK